MTISHCLQGLGTHFWPFQADAHDLLQVCALKFILYLVLCNGKFNIWEGCFKNTVMIWFWRILGNQHLQWTLTLMFRRVLMCARASSKRLCPWSCRWVCVSWQQAFSSSFSHEIEIKVKSRAEPADRLFPSMLNPGIGKKCNKKKHFKCHTLNNSFKAPFCYSSRLNI